MLTDQKQVVGAADNYWLDGKDRFAAERAAADAVLTEFPEVAEIARANRAFLARAVAMSPARV